MPAQPSHPAFNNQTSDDPFLAPNHSEESLVAIHSDYTPSHRSYYSPTPEPVLKSNDGSSTRATSEALQATLSQGDPSNGYQPTSPPNVHGGNGGWDDPYSFLAPHPYISDNGYQASSEHTATPENEPFDLEQVFGAPGDLNQQPGLNQELYPGSSRSQPVSATSGAGEFPSERNHRFSTGNATLSSHLMSPVLTDDQGISTRDATSSPPVYPGQLKKETGCGMQHTNMSQVPQFHRTQHTPAMTESSKNTSPDGYKPAQSISRAASPMIRVDQYARGDSPARSAEASPRPKRNRSGSFSSHLSVQALGGEEEDDAERFNQRTSRDPRIRNRISDVPIANFRDQEEASQLAVKNADVADWITHNAPVGGDSAELAPERPKDIGGRRRARSVGAQRLSQANLESLQTTPVDTHIPGPGLLIDESSGEEESEYDDETASIDDSPLPSPTEGMNEVPGEARPGKYDELSNQPYLYRAKLWQDPLGDSSDPGVKMQPISSNDAMERFRQRAADIEMISRVATWGTRRRSESDMTSLFRRFTLTSVKEDEGQADEEKARDRSGSIFERLRPRRNSTLRRKESDKQKSNSSSVIHSREHKRTNSGDSRRESLSVPKPVSTSIKRMGSLGKRPKSPKLDTGSAVAAMANPLAAVGTSGPLSNELSSPTGPFAAAKNALQRSTSRGELRREDSIPGSSNLANLWTQQGGPPMPNLVTPKTEEPSQMTGNDDDDEDDDADEPGIKIDLSIRPETIVPTLDGFREHVKLLNPRLPPFMIDRLGQEQLRRYKKLLDSKVKHVGAVQNKSCGSKKHCTELGGEPTYFESRAKKDPELPQIGFSVSAQAIGPSDEELNALAEGVVTAAQFPPGVPLPPTKRLPAEFECSLCFKVKKFNKPSDWSKHIHEDVQPFTCTFAQCAEPKSFKRKADWVRHENERHRQLEWWQCDLNDCTHRCYRKDNFVQHLVREHKLPEPNVKKVKAGKPAVRGPSAQKARNTKSADEVNKFSEEVDQVWRMVKTCQVDTKKSPKDEACKFCGNVCNTWKKLTVHLAKHMEQISMPVLAIVRDKDVTADTIISPVENSKITSHARSQSPVQSPGSQSGFPPPIGPMMPDSFTSIPPQGGYLPDQQSQRGPPYTYPSPRQQQQLVDPYIHFARSHNPNIMPKGPHYNHSPPQFDTLNDSLAFGADPTSSPEEMYGMQPTAQPRPQPYQAGSYRSIQSQQYFTNSPPAEEVIYRFDAATSAPTASQMTSTAYPQHPNRAGMYGHAAPMGTGVTTPEQLLQQQQQLQDQLNGQAMGYNANAMGFGAVTDEEAGGYGQGRGQPPTGGVAGYGYHP